MRRLIAALIDSAITSIIAVVVSLIFSLPKILITGVFVVGAFPFLQGVIFFLYAMFMESNSGATFGKHVMNLKVTTVEEKRSIDRPSLDRTAIRNISKIHGLLWLIDTLIGLATIGEPHQKYSDRFAKTTVISTIQKNMILPS